MRDLINIIEQQNNEGIANKLATAALLGATALGSPAMLAHAEPTPTTHTIGGWYPIIFQNWDESKIQDIIDRKSDTRRILITYDANKPLAKQIYTTLKNSGMPVEAEHTPNQDTEETQYDHDSVTVTVYRK
jgi:hypothetical protein